MELKLANYIRKMQSMGAFVETWMIQLEARCIFCEQNPESIQLKLTLLNVEIIRWNIHQSLAITGLKVILQDTTSNTVTESVLRVIQNYHLSLQMKQLLEINDPMYALWFYVSLLHLPA